ncbi:methyl-accepting chemotaxis protein [Seleniivibrio woodruffii]|uniref:Methyl-accepting chemotaxis sensory transducer n=1 Tax=Seleniivibrio woodruffii TaxID=1078050 RepID=A0A4R1K6R5_9BACT|nr:methyl-accepting chemotaxis protein [Seleniivibrio woodruffii]TCK59936.1 methyl-accepting chemotaxis sensory transducer [Seleniivibrio woodruffii]TVZ35843.1 methyl-accepting chemotaxis protein [Seleniivibrio woodruffii]
MKIDMSLKKKIVLLGATVFVGLSLIIISSVISSTKLTNLFQDKELTLNIKAEMLQLRKSEKDFMMRNDTKYAEEFKTHIDILDENLDQLVIHYPENKALSGIIDNLKEYETQFISLVELKKQIGLNEKEGYYGNLRQKVHEVEDFSNKLGLTAVTRDMLMLRRHEKDFMLRRNMKYKDSFEQDFNKLISSVKSNVADKATADQMIGLSNEYRNNFLKLVEKEKEFGLQSTDGEQGKMRSAAHNLEQNVNTAIDHFSEEITAKEKINRILNTTIISIVVVILTVIILALLKNIIELINRLAATTKDLLQFGNLESSETAEQKCEISTISILLERFKQKVYNTMTVVKSSSHSVASGSTQLSAATEELSSTFTSQSEQMTASAGAMEEMTASSKLVIDNIEQSATMNIRTLTSTETGRKKLDTLLMNINNIEQDTKKLSATIRELSGSSEEIGNILVVINDIADQTNLLALNAAIEAARAGEAGRGFAVVADEVRKLAEKTQQAIKNISDIINTLVKDTRYASEDMERAAHTVTQVFTAANEAGRSFNEITDTIHELNRTNNNIEVAVKEQVEAIQNINDSFQVLVSGIEESNAAVIEIGHTVNDLQKQSEDLNSLIKEFNI